MLSFASISQKKKKYNDRSYRQLLPTLFNGSKVSFMLKKMNSRFTDAVQLFVQLNARWFQVYFWSSVATKDHWYLEITRIKMNYCSDKNFWVTAINISYNFGKICPLYFSMLARLWLSALVEIFPLTIHLGMSCTVLISTCLWDIMNRIWD